jgi:hypothetical protein
VGETFLLFEKITSPTHCADFASLICFVRRGIKFCDIKNICLVMLVTKNMIL